VRRLSRLAGLLGVVMGNWSLTICGGVGDMRLYLLGLNHLPPDASDKITKAIAIQVNAVWSVEMPIARKASPRMRKTEE